MSAHAPFVVQGVALVVDQKGKESRLILRYPSINTNAPPSSSPAADDMNQELLFFRMDPRQMAKLFRPQPSLCGQPMTLSVGGTIFCCRAVLLGENTSTSSTEPNDNHNNNNEQDENKVELFSIIVALRPRVSEISMTITGGWYEEEEKTKAKGDAVTSSKATMAFLAIVRTHLSLNRICSVLEREERRCQYVTLQSMLVLQIRKMFMDPPSSATSPVTSSKRPPRHNNSTAATEATTVTATDQNVSIENRDCEQDILETAMAAHAPVDTQRGITHKGNLVRELVQFYHILSQCEDDFPTISPTVLGMENIIHVNGHIAVSVEAVGKKAHMQYYFDHRALVRPYQTLLFPNKTRKELLQYMASSSAPRPVQQFLLAASPQKSLSEIASDSSISQQNTMEIASYLIEGGAAIASPKITPRSQLACSGVSRIQDAALAFSYAFGPDVDIFQLVAYLTSGWTLEEARKALVSSTSPETLSLCASLRSAIRVHPSAKGPDATSGLSTAVDQTSIEESLQLEEILYRMAFWLCARQAVEQLLEYMIEPVDPTRHRDSTSDNEDESTTNVTEKKTDLSKEYMLLQQLRREDCLSGRISLHAASWKVGVDVALLRDVAARNPSIRVIKRLPAAGDDWESSHHFF